MSDLWQLDPTPTWEEERRDFPQEDAATGEKPYSKDEGRNRLDAVAHNLAKVWSFFLVYVIVAQGVKGGLSVVLGEWRWWIVPPFHLETAAFIAVVTTTTATVMGFLVLVGRWLFKD